MSDSTIEIIGGRERRRRWSAEEKLRIVAETHEPGANVRAVAARHDVYPNLLRTWRRQVRESRLVASPPVRFMPVRVAETAPMVPGVAPSSRDRAAAETVEIVVCARASATTSPGRLAPYHEGAAWMIAPPPGVRVWLAAGVTDMTDMMTWTPPVLERQ
jgi:transposase